MSGNRVIRLVSAPPIEQRPVCPGCGTRLRPWYDVRKYAALDKPGSMAPNEVAWSGDYHRYGSFCTLRCATGFANRVISRTSNRADMRRFLGVKS